MGYVVVDAAVVGKMRMGTEFVVDSLLAELFPNLVLSSFQGFSASVIMFAFVCLCVDSEKKSLQEDKRGIDKKGSRKDRKRMKNKKKTCIVSNRISTECRCKEDVI